MDALRFPWGDDERRREVAPSTFRPRTTTRKPAGDASVRKPDDRQVARRAANRSRRPSPVAPAAHRVTATQRREGPATTPGREGPANPRGHAARESARDRVPGRVVQGPQRERHEPDYILLLAAVGLTALGILMVYSSLGVRVAVGGGSIFDGIRTQLGWGLLGALVLVLAMRADYRRWRTVSVVGLGVALVMLVLVVGPEIGPLVVPETINGATRWLRIGPLPSFQPTELAKLALVVFLAHFLSSRGHEVRSFRRGLLPLAVLVAAIAGLVLMEPDLGTTGVIVLTAFTMLFVAGGSILQLALLLPVGIAGVAGMIMLRPYQLGRIQVFLDPFADAGGDGFQTVQGLYALALGGVTGQGLGESRQPGGLRLPAAENDFIFAVVGQELGLIGGLLVIGLFLVLAWRGIRVAMNAPDTFGGLLAMGITAWLAFQAFINIGVVVVLVPLTGMPLPFLSDGGTSLVVVLAAVGILLSISRETVTRGVSAHEDAHRGWWHRRPHLPRPGRRDPAAGQAT